MKEGCNDQEQRRSLGNGRSSESHAQYQFFICFPDTIAGIGRGTSLLVVLNKLVQGGQQKLMLYL